MAADGRFARGADWSDGSETPSRRARFISLVTPPRAATRRAASRVQIEFGW